MPGMTARERFMLAMHGIEQIIKRDAAFRRVRVDVPSLKAGLVGERVAHAALVNLLIDRNLISREGYEDVLARAAEAELAYRQPK